MQCALRFLSIIDSIMILHSMHYLNISKFVFLSSKCTPKTVHKADQASILKKSAL